MTAEIPLRNGGVALADDDDAPLLLQFKWYTCRKKLTGRTYAVAARIDGKVVLMHRVVMGLGAGRSIMVDHVNGNPTDNRKSNLRLATNAENLRNRKRHSNNKSGFKGVSREGNRWCASIKFCRRKYRLGSFPTPEMAHAAYCAKARELHGEFARFL
jgi:hypothetical protein